MFADWISERLEEDPNFLLKIIFSDNAIYKKLLFGFEMTGEFITANSQSYRMMLKYFLWPKLNDMNVYDTWSQQDGATYHTEGHSAWTIWRYGYLSQRWRELATNIVGFDSTIFFLGSFLKSHVHANNKPANDRCHT